MQEHAKSRTSEAVPKTSATRQLSEEEKHQLEVSEQADHSTGQEKERAVQHAAARGNSDGK